MSDLDAQELYDTLRTIDSLLWRDRTREAVQILAMLRGRLRSLPDVEDRFMPAGFHGLTDEERRALLVATDEAADLHAIDLVAREREMMADLRELRAVRS